MSHKTTAKKKKKDSRRKSGFVLPTITYSRGKLGHSIFEEGQGFNQVDPTMKLMNLQYNSLHDPHLKHFFKQPWRKRHLKKLGLITADNKVLCTLKEFREYMGYRKAVQMSWENHLLEEQKMFLKQFLILKLNGRIVDTITMSDMRDWLLQQGMKTFKKMYKRNGKPRCIANYDKLLWQVKQSFQLDKLEKEVIRELRMERRLQQKTESVMEKPWTAGVYYSLSPSRPGSGSFFQILETLHEEPESLRASARPESSAELTDLEELFQKLSIEAPKKSTYVLEAITALLESPEESSSDTSLSSTSSSSSSSSDKQETTHPTEFEAITLDDPNAQPSTSHHDDSPVCPDDITTSTTERFDSAAFEAEMMLKEMVEELIQYGNQELMLSRDEAEPKSSPSPQSGDQQSLEVPSDPLSETPPESYLSQFSLTRDIVRCALNRVAGVISENEALFSQNKLGETSTDSAASACTSQEEPDRAAGCQNDSNHPYIPPGGNSAS